MAFAASCTPTWLPSSRINALENHNPFHFPPPSSYFIRVLRVALCSRTRRDQMAGGGGKKSRSCAWAGRLLIWAVASVAAVHGSVVVHNVGAAPAPAEDCSSAILSLSGCLTFVQAGSTEAKPQKECCAGLKKVVKRQAGCLCDAFKQGASFGVKLNMTKALALPHACGVSTSHLGKCTNVLPGGPAASPAPSPSSGAGIAPSPSAGHTSGAAAVPLSTLEPGRVIIAVAAVALSFYFYF